MEETRPRVSKAPKVYKAETKIEKNACEQAKQKAIERATKAKQEEYDMGMEAFLKYERLARRYRADADELAESLSITKADIKELF